ncbi:hypothetical protein PQE75_gp004 [Bacillus phage vB_BcoS-136]|uniref:Uncharacterized protein n=1 Tax=Bacillus phage vB_BcoS-136 TaxID=2419619 RepID=A0A3G3BVQ9_9CAUD|nr:hypothetical protein PQE75_gp004 [Bacillus phage vB_BcoS-136]AYP68136.1 hypothetical protein vBBcoS136_00004 [Bacillus phage vB_BcoS-136]
MNKSKTEILSDMLFGDDFSDFIDRTGISSGQDSYGDYYIIFDTHEEMSEFIRLINEKTGSNFDNDYEVEREFDIEMVFSDEYTLCSDCHEVIRTSPTGYGWQPDFYMGDGFIVCNKCFNEHEDYQESYLLEKINNPMNAVNGLITEKQMEELGFEKLNGDSYESGLHSHQTDSPKEIFNELSDKHDEVVFYVDSVGQFDIDFSVWVR